jgi:hypothetical protein
MLKLPIISVGKDILSALVAMQSKRQVIDASASDIKPLQYQCGIMLPDLYLIDFNVASSSADNKGLLH